MSAAQALYDRVKDYDVSLAECRDWLGDSCDESFAHYAGDIIARCMTKQDELSVLSFRRNDLLWAFQCQNRDTEAITRLTSAVHSIGESLARRFPQDPTDDICQDLLTALLSDGKESLPHIRDFQGRSALASWMYTIAFRQLARRCKSTNTSHDLMDELCEVGYDPELEMIKKQYAELFRNALSEAIASLDAKERLIISQVTIDQLSTASIAKQQQVHPATVRRWIATIRKTVHTRTRAALRKSVGNETTLTSVLKMLSQFDAQLTSDFL